MNKLISSLFALLVGCSPAPEQAKNLTDTFPPSLEVVLLHERGTAPDLIIVADDEHNLSRVLGRIPNADHSTPRPSSGLQRIELYEDFELRQTIPVSGSQIFTSYSPAHQEGSFTSRVVVYDNAGNKTESTPIELIK